MGEAAPLGLRERNKINKLGRIREAARHLFATQGYQNTSTREIAHRAHVGLATLFLYAENKRDLLFLAFSADLEELASRPFDRMDAELSLLDQLISVFRYFFEFYNGNRELSRDLLREIAIYTSGRQHEVFHQTREATIAGVETLIAASRMRGEIAPAADDAALAHLTFDVFASSLRRWLGMDEATLADGLQALRESFRMLMAGFQPQWQDA